MKTRYAHAICRLGGAVSLTILTTITWMATPTFAGFVHTLSITENSPISLSVTFDGSAFGTVVNTLPDQWTVTLPREIQINASFGGNWIEPENPLRFNIVATDLTNVNHDSIIVHSDSLPGEFSQIADGAAILLGTDLTDGASVFAQFHDQAAANETPDTAFTFGLFLFSLTTLLGASRFRWLRTG